MEEWKKIESLNKRHGISNLTISQKAEAYRIAADSGQASSVPYVDDIVTKDIRATLETGRGILESVFDIPTYQEMENKRAAERWAAQMKLEAEKRKAEAAQREIELKKQKRAALAEELGIPLAKLE